MRLFLASYRFGANPAALVDLVGRPGRIGVIAAACDAWTPNARAGAVTSELVSLRGLGFDPVEIDLRRETDPAERLSEVPAVWVRGGNTFVLRHQLAVSGFDRALTELVVSGDLIYGGYSAGACVTGPDLRGLEYADPIEEVVELAGPQVPIPTAGLGWLDRVIVAHFRSAELGGAESDRMIADLDERAAPYLTLTDEQAIIVDGPDASAPTIIG